jgi:DNA-binding transcriptional LysR family regulator
MIAPLSSLHGLSIERLRTFCAIIENGSIAAAARGDPVKQSQFSRQVRELEEVLGTKLFRRVGKTLQVTESGRQFALLTQTYFHAVDDLRLSVARESETIRFAAGESVFHWLIMPRLGEIQTALGSIRLDCQIGRTLEAVQGVKDGSIDLAIVRRTALDEDLASATCGKMDYRLVVPRALLPGRSAAGFELVRKLPMALLGGDGEFAKGVQALAAKNNRELEIRFRAASFSLVIAALQHLELAAIIPAAAVNELSKERYAAVEFASIENLTRELVLIHNPKAAQLRESIRRTAARVGKVLST